MRVSPPTPYPDVNRMLDALLAGVRPVLGSGLVGLYLDGSLASGDFDQASDIDFVAVAEDEIPEEVFLALRAMHDRLARLDSPYATDLEGSYLSRQAVRRYDPAYTLYPNLERGQGERLKLVRHDEMWVVHRYLLRKRAITVVGPPPASLVDPVSSADLRQGMTALTQRWLAPLLRDPSPLAARGYQSYTVLSLCRLLYTLRHDAVTSKRVAAEWAQTALDPRWWPLIQRAQADRLAPTGGAAPDAVAETLAFIQWVVVGSQ